jgi:hypothetical protein
VAVTYALKKIKQGKSVSVSGFLILEAASVESAAKKSVQACGTLTLKQTSEI